MTYNNNFHYRRKPGIQKKPIIVLCVVLAVIIAVAVFFIVRHFNAKKEETESFGKCSWSTEGFGKIYDAKVLGETFIVFSEEKDGKVGLMTLDGKITENAEHNDFYICSTEWREEIFVADSPVSDYPLIVDAETGKITTRQFNKESTPERVPVWSTDADYLYWSSKNSGATQVKRSDVNLTVGWYPVPDRNGEGAKWGYVNELLFLDIALVYDAAEDFSEGLAAVCSNGKWGYINSEGVDVISLQYQSLKGVNAEEKDTAFSFRNGFVPVKKGDKFGIINAKGETVVEFKFDAILQGKNGKYVACKDGNWGVITLSKDADNGAATTAPEVQTSPESPVSLGSYIVRTSGSSLRIRRDTNTDSIIVAQIPNGTVIEVTKAVSGWAYVKYGVYEGWVNSAYIEKYTPPAATTAAVTEPTT